MFLNDLFQTIFSRRSVQGEKHNKSICCKQGFLRFLRVLLLPNSVEFCVFRYRFTDMFLEAESDNVMFAFGQSVTAVATPTRP
jgi:hypothetical protein